ncbi:MAG: hypothetical protein ACYDG4_08370 [Desulfuromonadaceae bacterium]
MDEKARSTEDIRQDIAREEENLSRTAQKIGERIKEKLDLSEYAKDSPYWALGIAVGIGFFASRVLQTRMTPMERIMGSLAEVRGTLGGLHVGAAPPGLAKLALLGIGTKLAADWIRNASSPPSETESDLTSTPEATT